MPTRRLSAPEISIIKKMLEDKLIKQDILAYFTRPSGSINPARIREIETGERGQAIPRATDQQLHNFIASFQDPNLGNLPQLDTNPFSEGHWKELRRLDPKCPKRLLIQEGQTIEFKESFHRQQIYKYLKTMSGMANNRGGYLLFGIANDRTITGLNSDSFDNYDTATISNKIESSYDKIISWEKQVRQIDDRSIGLIYTFESDDKPVKCIKNSQSTKEGEVYFRYTGKTDRMRQHELNRILGS